MTLDDLIDWLEGQDPNTTYAFCQARTCLITRYENARLEERRHWWQRKPSELVMRDGDEMPEPLFKIACRNHTFRGALIHAYKLRTEREMKNAA